MSSPPTDAPRTESPDGENQRTNDRAAESTRRFALWALDTLHLPVERESEWVYRFETPEHQRSAFNGAGQVRFAFDKPPRSGETVELMRPGSRMFQWLLEQLRDCPQPLHARPADTVHSVSDLSPKLFEAYTVDGGSVHLAGCSLDLEPLLCLIYRVPLPRENVAASQATAGSSADGDLDPADVPAASADNASDDNASDDNASDDNASDDNASADKPSDDEPSDDNGQPSDGTSTQSSGEPAEGASVEASCPDSLQQVFVLPSGEPIDAALQTEMGLERLQSLDTKPPPLPVAVQDWSQTARQVAAKKCVGVDRATEPVVEIVVWCTRASGKLSFEIGEGSAELPFSGWARDLASGAIGPPPYVCPRTGLSSHHLAASHNGAVTVAEALVPCDQTGKLAFEDELETCAATGKRVLPECLVECPVTGSAVMEAALVGCTTCRQAVSPKCIQGGRCTACRTLRPLSKDDPRMARVLGEYPQLDQWRNWRISETAAVYVLTATTLFRRLLVVLDKDTLHPHTVATAGRLGFGWTDAPQTLRAELLGE